MYGMTVISEETSRNMLRRCTRYTCKYLRNGLITLRVTSGSVWMWNFSLFFCTLLCDWVEIFGVDGVRFFE